MIASQLEHLRAGLEETIELPGLRTSGHRSRKARPVRVTLRLTDEGRAAASDDASWGVLAARIRSDLLAEVARIVQDALGITVDRPPYSMDCDSLKPIFDGAVAVLWIRVGVGGRLVHAGELEIAEREGSAAAEPPGDEELVTDAETEATAGAEPPEEAAGEVGRTLQCLVGPTDPDAVKDNIIRAGVNQVDVFIGQQRQNWVSLSRIAESEVVYGSDDVADLVVMLTPTQPVVGTPTCHALRLPRHGDSEVVGLDWIVPADAARATAQLVLLQGPRVLALAELSGEVGGKVALVSRQAIGSADSWQTPSTIERAIILDTASDGRSILIDPASAEVRLFSDLTQLGEELCAAFGAAPALKKPKPDTLASGGLKILIKAARVGVRLRRVLKPLLGDWADAKHLQVVTGGSPIQLPLELLYDLPTPRDGAVLCPTWVDQGSCGPDCGGDDPGAIVCPAAFWGLNRVIERHYWVKGRGEAWLCEPAPNQEHARLTLDGTLLAASVKVSDDVLAQTALDQFPRCSTWADWRLRLADPPGEGLLILLPHNEDHALEISQTWLEEGDVDKPYVIGTSTDRRPLVVLLGCETAGSPSDLYGCGSYFLGADAAVVLGTLASVDATVAAWLASMIVGILREPSVAGRSIGEVMTELRRAALRKNMVSALALTAYGDSRWVV